MGHYLVTFCKAHEEPRQIATAANFAEAAAAARKAGAVHEGEQVGRDFVFDVVGHEGDDDFAIWIETPRRALSHSPRIGRFRWNLLPPRGL